MKSPLWNAALAGALLAAGTARAQGGAPCSTSVESPKKKAGIGGLLRSLRTVSGVAGVVDARRPAGMASVLANGATIASTVGGGKKCSDERNPVQSRPASTVRDKAGTTPAASGQTYQRVADIPAPPGFAEAKAALDAFGKYPCAGCEGGFGYDSWVYANISGQLKGLSVAEKVATMKVGEALHWKGRISTGSLTVVGADPVGGIECRQVNIRLVKGKLSAERPGLYCKGGFKWIDAY